MARRKNISKQTRAVLFMLLDNQGERPYGYEISKATGLKSGSLYPILMRLKDQGLLAAHWEDSPLPGRPPRHMYRLTGDGRDLALQLRSDDSLSDIPARFGARFEAGGQL